MTVPSEFFGNAVNNFTQKSNITVTIVDWSEQIKNFASDWINPISGMVLTIISVGTAIIGIGIGRKTKKNN